MAKRRFDFRPDPTGTGFANKLYLSPQQRRKAMKWLLYSLVCLAALILQDTLLSRVRVEGGLVDFAPAAIALVCVMEGSHSGSLFALIASMVYVFSGTGQGFYCITFLTVYSVLLAVFRQSYLRRSFSSDWLCAAAAVALYEVSVFGMGLFFGLTYSARFGVFLMTALLSAISMPGLYPLLRKIGSIGGETWKE